jgi:hypothetical protein
LFEINPMEINQNPEKEKQNFFEKIKENKDNIAYY